MWWLDNMYIQPFVETNDLNAKIFYFFIWIMLFFTLFVMMAHLCSWSINIVVLTGSWMKRGQSCSSCRVCCKQWRSCEKLDSLYLILCCSSWVAQIKAPVLHILTGNKPQYLWNVTQAQKHTLAWPSFWWGGGRDMELQWGLRGFSPTETISI